MRKVLILLFALLILSVPLAALAQEETDEETWVDALDKVLGQWKRSFAAPSYGIALFSARVEGPGTLGDQQSKFLVPAVDLRIMRGTNVSRRGGFFTGIETGVLVFTNLESRSQFSDTVFYPEYNNGVGIDFPLDFGVSMEGGLVFLMSRYGLRLDLGVSLIGVSLGIDLGAGASLFSGGYRFYVGPSPDESVVDVGSGSSAAIMGLIVDGNAEAALRLGKNFRIFVKAGFIVSPIDLPSTRFNEYRYIADADLDPAQTWVTDTDRQRYLLSQYRLNLDVFALNARLGFALNFD